MAAAAQAMSKVASNTARRLSTLDTLLCPSIAAFRDALPRETRLVGLDVTDRHISLSVCDRHWHRAAPFGILSRTKHANVDAKLLKSAFVKAEEYEAQRSGIDEKFIIGGLVINVPPTTTTSSSALASNQYEYVRDLLTTTTGEEKENGNLFPNLQACLFYSEAHALRHAINSYRDYVNAVKLLPKRKLEAKRRSRFDQAMNPDMVYEEIVKDSSAIARISASEVLQAVLDDISKIDRASVNADS